MREIEFRGKLTDTGGWVSGYYYSECGNYYIIENRQRESMLNRNLARPVSPETVGQYTGLKDMDGKMIFTGDIIHFTTTEGKGVIKEVSWKDKYLCYFIGNVSYERLIESGYIQSSTLFCNVIGNIHDNPELLGAGG